MSEQREGALLDVPMTRMRLTERDMLDRLWARYAAKSQATGRRYVMAEHVRSSAGFDARNTADAIAVDTWNSSGWAIHGFEVKVSRSDWQHELARPWKAEAFRPYCDYWWLVAGSADIVRDDLPDGWGLLVASGATLRRVETAPRLHPEPMPDTMRVSLLRATLKTGLAWGSRAPAVSGEAT